ncbi:MAG: hypothetical protein IT463_14480 [Planctomycetes bacterium]|nr:hypothetical protein [Planctomycetota bacterium]
MQGRNLALYAAAAVLPGLCLWAAAAVVPVRSQHLPETVYKSVIAIEQAPWKWSEAKKGSLKGSVSFTGRLSAQPVVLYLQRDDAEGTFDPPAALNVSQKGARFNPSFALLVRGQKVVFDNDEDDEISHNVYFLGASEVDLGMFDRGNSREHTMSDAGEVSVHCSIHKLMDARFFVAPSPACTTLGAEDTSFALSNLPAGRYKLKSWQKQKRFKDIELAVEVVADKETSVTVEMAR